jgi:S-formylglutathione hydrolase
VPWGTKAFSGYLAGGVAEGKDGHDATAMIGEVKGAVHILVDYVRVSRVFCCFFIGKK